MTQPSPPVALGRSSRKRVRVEPGEILLGRKRPEAMIYVNPVKMAVEDVSPARAVYDAVRNQNIGTYLN